MTTIHEQLSEENRYLYRLVAQQKRQIKHNRLLFKLIIGLLLFELFLTGFSWWYWLTAL